MAWLGPPLAGAGEEIPLYEIDAHRTERVELLARLDPLGEGSDAALTGEPDQAAQHGQLVGIPMGPVDEAPIDLDEVGMELEDVRHAGIPGPDVVDGEHGRLHRPALKAAPQELVVEYRFVLGDLDHPGRQAVQNVVDPRVEHGARAQVDEEPHVARGRTAVTGSLEARQLELGADPEVRRPLEPLIGTAAARNCAAGEQFESEDAAVGQADDGLGVHADRSGHQELFHQAGQGVRTVGLCPSGTWRDVGVPGVGQLGVNSHGSSRRVGRMGRPNR